MVSSAWRRLRRPDGRARVHVYPLSRDLTWVYRCLQTHRCTGNFASKRNAVSGEVEVVSAETTGRGVPLPHVLLYGHIGRGDTPHPEQAPSSKAPLKFQNPQFTHGRGGEGGGVRMTSKFRK